MGWTVLHWSYHDADHFWSDSLFMTALALTSSEKSWISFVLSVKDMNSSLALIKIKKSKGPRILPWGTPVLVSWVSDSQFLRTTSIVLYCSDNPSTNPTKDQKNLFFNLKIKPENLEGDRGLWVNYYCFLDLFYVDDHFDYFGGHIGYDFSTIMWRK